MEGLLERGDSLAEVEEALAAALDDVRGRGYVALKSIAAYSILRGNATRLYML